MDAGRILEKQKASQETLIKVRDTYEAMAKLLQRTQQENKIQQAQSIEFAKQISQSSRCVADFQKAVEAVKLQMTKLTVTLGPSPSPIIAERSDDVTSIVSVPEEITPFTLVKSVQMDGTFLNVSATVKIPGGIVKSVDVKVPMAS